MYLRSGWARTLSISIALCLAGCAATRHEPPPEVVPQPPDVTTTQVIAEERSSASGGPVAESGRSAGALAQAAPRTQATPRNRPTIRSVEEIRGQRATTPYPLDFSQRLDEAHDRVYAWTQELVLATDNRFVGEGEPARPVPAAPFRLGVTGESILREGGPEFDLEAQFDIALSLPNLERRLRIFVTSSGLDESPRNERGSEGLRAGLRYELLRYLEFDLGVKVDAPPVLFAALNWRREFRLGSWDFYPFAKLFAETRESVGYAAATTFDHWSGRTLLRSSTYAKWRADRDRTQWSQTLVFARAHELLVPDRYGSYTRASDIGRGWGVRLLAGGESANSVDEYEAAVFHRRPLPNRWIYWSVEPLVRWDRDHRWSADPGIRIGIEALFWDLVRPGR